MLHIVKHYRALNDVIDYSLAEDKILLVEDAVYAAVSGHKSHGLLKDATQGIYVLEADLQARGLEGAGFTVVDFGGFVGLTEGEGKSVTW
ncbi:sulfurtransferase complex subunit TusB [Vibrio sp. JC009]|uniref:sulfurtransferase complex subunit TusB n=1 Tax=Vibrio sp. JC009 TaxID=2912314 RepID=UPI0023AE912F|nr:sulfurtransferase complex subunit TusB [Vibrio sp. JC009]WED22081.1 sulfurtransferase complex subunit TusB [Vibrio sp. JC009]